MVDRLIVEDALVFTGMMTLLGCVTKVVLTLLRRRAGEALPAAITAQLRELVTRLERLEHGVEATAVEVERIAEGQRFVTRVLAERAPERALSDPTAARARVVTPH
jgi:hypothetical protein